MSRDGQRNEKVGRPPGSIMQIKARRYGRQGSVCRNSIIKSLKYMKSTVGNKDEMEM